MFLVHEWLKFTVVELFFIMYATKKSLLFSGTFYHVLLEPSTICNITKLREEMLNNILNKLNSYWVEIFVEFALLMSLIYNYSVLSYENIKQTYHHVCLLYGSGSKFKLCGSTVYVYLYKMVFNDDPRFCLPVNSREYVEMPHFAQYIYTSLCFVRYRLTNQVVLEFWR